MPGCTLLPPPNSLSTFVSSGFIPLLHSFLSNYKLLQDNTLPDLLLQPPKPMVAGLSDTKIDSNNDNN